MRDDIARVLEEVRYVAEKEVQESLVAECRAVVERLKSSGVDEADIVVAPANMVGASAQHAFVIVRRRMEHDYPRLKFHAEGPASARDLISIKRESAVVFLDDFIGSGDQFGRSFSAWTDALMAKSPKWVLVTAVACSEGIRQIEDKGALVQTRVVHEESGRFWAVCLSALGQPAMERLIVLACELQATLPFGHRNTGSMVVLYRNCPTNVPLLLRGTDGQRVWFGLFPRKDQLSARPFAFVLERVRWPKSGVSPFAPDAG